eukprot:TRINITY_DN2790_c0_g1_i2.p1 TRINITY_DN2790_c0_g1~~TRINITY_DN2790_c0_g1_i2.p1  ORF type:complete len:701 (-),score=144.39 TRINITY_DN2790_c0_g1_i2:20-1858(-)
MGPFQSGINTAPAATQLNVTVNPTQTKYVFSQSGVLLELTFTSPLLPNNIDILARPVSYITFRVTSVDGRSHHVSLYYDNTAEMVVNSPTEFVTWGRINVNSMTVMRMGSQAQNILGMSGDRVGINWGYNYVAVPNGSGLSTVIYDSGVTRSQFVKSGTIPTADDTRQPRAASDAWPCMAVVWDLGSVSSASQTRHITFAYDEIYSIKWFNHNFRPYWRRDPSSTPNTLISAADQDYNNVLSLCNSFDNDLLSRLQRAGGDQYATLASLVFRQSFGGCKLVWNDQKNILWYFMKEISSNGDLQTVDVVFPASPIFLHQNPLLLKKLVIPHLVFSSQDPTLNGCNYNKAWAPHQLGTYPVAYCMGQEDMPVEETANLILMLAKIAQLTGDLSEVIPEYWPLLQKWGQYLVSALPDPGNQLCTDDFEGPSPHNANLAAKGIVGLAAMSKLCAFVKDSSCETYYMNTANNMAQQWQKLAVNSDGSHYKLEYDKDNTWSLKYNILYQKLLNVSVFPEDVIRKELNYYLTQKLNTYGVPLDNRATFTKLDWSVWAATMGDDTQFQTIINRIYNFANQSPSRVPLSDWYDTISGKQVGFQARTVLGALYSKILLLEKP